MEENKKESFNLVLKNFFKSFKWYEYTYLIIALISIILLSIFFNSTPITISYSIIGILYVICLAKKIKWGIFLGIAQTSLYITQSVYYSNWGEVILNATIVLPAIILSLFSWFIQKKEPSTSLNSDNKNKEIKSNRISKTEWIILFLMGIIVYVSFFFILKYLKTPYFPIASASCVFTTIAHYLMIRKSGLMFIFFICTNVFMLVIWLLPIAYGVGYSIESIPMLVTIFIYALSNVIGTINWKKENNTNTKTL